MSGKLEFNELPAPIQKHLQTIAEDQKRSEEPGYLEDLAAVWNMKADIFLGQIKTAGLELVESLSRKDTRGFLVLSYSGSLLSIGPVNLSSTNINSSRWMEYSSIKLRTDVPDIILEKHAVLAGDVQVGKGVRLDEAKIKSTSPAYLVAVCPEGLDEEEQDRIIRESIIYIATSFMKFNRTLQIDKSNIPDQFTMKSMTRYNAKKHGLTGQESKLIVDDFLTLIETGMLLGESVPFGKLGRFSIKERKAQNARKVKHPSTGEEMIIEAKPAMGVPKISFSSYLKDRAAAVSGRQETE